MADFDVSYSIENEQQFWDELNEIVTTRGASHELIDNSLRAWLYLVSSCRDRFLDTEDDIATCSQKLIESQIFCDNKDYVRTQIIYSLLQEDEFCSLHAIANFLLLSGRNDESTFRYMIEEGCFARLLELLRGTRDPDRRLHRLLMELMYEMSRIERLRPEDLIQVDDAFVTYLFQLIESLSEDSDDPYHYPVIRVLLVLNEQYMVAATSAAVESSEPAASLTNRVIKTISVHGPQFRTFGENIILLLNRETETSLQLLILKLLYLLFTTQATCEYFYTNDLRVLLDVIIRNLLDLPNEMMALRHTYLRVLYPLLAHTQLRNAPHYKRDEILRVLRILGGSGNVHFAPADETTLRLVDRVAKVSWLLEEERSGEAEVAQKFLGISLDQSQSASSVSVGDVAAVTEKPGVKTPSRRTEFGREVVGEPEEMRAVSGAEDAAKKIKKVTPSPRPKKALPAVPKHRHGVPTISPPSIRVSADAPKKLPPKLPPPRRGTRIKSAASTEALRTSSSLPSLPGSTEVS